VKSRGACVGCVTSPLDKSSSDELADERTRGVRREAQPIGNFLYSKTGRSVEQMDYLRLRFRYLRLAALSAQTGANRTPHAKQHTLKLDGRAVSRDLRYSLWGQRPIARTRR
jgi:hypothetical protein